MSQAPLSPARRRRTLLVLCAALGAALLLAVLVGPDEVGLGVLHEPELLRLRVARVLLAAVVGAGLAATGSALQATLNNPLADPYVLGVSGGAAMGGALAVALGAGAAGLGLHAAAAVGAFGATALLAWFLARDRGGRAETPLLVGVSLNAFSWALVSLVRATVSASKTQTLSVWLVGSIGYPSPRDLAIAAVVTAVGVALLVWRAGDLTLLRAGEDEARRLGVDVARVRLVIYGAASLLVGVAVSTSGVIGFLGLIAPHAVRLTISRDERLALPAAALVGAAALVAFDALARGSFALFDSEIPTGALCAVIGAPLFALGLWRKVVGAGGQP
ncbi:MAG: iron chelate uptake ABC transporter family permease subunit [Deltaproteobacteria bacterium]|nr:iron chelate uptake ABC transporter family permease subunit [Deltaproteobacteria bacterium]